MKTKLPARVVIAAAALGLIASPVLADEIVHFTNGAEMPVRSHTVDKEQSMVKLDLGGNNFISFPMIMVDKIVSAGQDVFRNPGFYPSNQAIAGVPGSTVADTGVRGAGGSVGYKPQPDGKGHAGVMLGEAADAIPAGYPGGPTPENSLINQRRRFNPAFPPPPGAAPQVIMPGGGAPVKRPAQLQMKGAPAVEPPPPPAPEADPDEPPAENPPDNP